MFATLKMLLVWVSLGAPAGIVGMPWSLLVGNVDRMYRWGTAIARLGIRAAGIRVEVTGREHIPAGRACIFMSNHVSNLDPPILMPMLPGRCSVLLKKELMSIPILGRAMRMAKFVPVGRAGSRTEAAKSVTAAAETLRSGLSIMVFPEGTRSRDGRLAAFKKGPFFLAEQTGAPIVPVAISGTERMMPKGTLKLSPGAAKVQMLRVIEPGEYGSREELMRAVREAIAEALPEEMKPVATPQAAGVPPSPSSVL